MPLPAPYATDIDVDEIRLLIIPDTTALHRERGISEFRGLNVTQPHIDRIAQHMLAFLCDAAAFYAQHGVRLRRTIGRNHFVGSIAPE